MVSFSKAFILLAAVADATPRDYWKKTSAAVKENRDHMRELRTHKPANDKAPEAWRTGRALKFDASLVALLTPQTNISEWCGTKSSGQKQWFTENKCSLASTDMTYLDPHNNIREAKKGDVVAMECDSVMCPTPMVPDCYTTPEDAPCAADEWCMLNQQEVWSAAAGAGGGTSLAQFEFCEEFQSAKTSTPELYHQHLQTAKNLTSVTLEQSHALFKSANSRCGGSNGMAYGIAIDSDTVDMWKGARGRCVKYRQEGQSCVPQMDNLMSSSGLLPKTASGKNFERPLMCGKGLQCTGADFDVMPSTCVPERPQDVCFLGPWWDSTVCPRTTTAARGGLDYETALNTVRSFLLLFAGDVSSPSTCEYWDSKTRLGKATYQARTEGYAIVSALWPSQISGKFAEPGLPSFEQFETEFELPGVSRKDCDAGAKDANSAIARQLALSHLRTERANFIWSIIHFLMHNQPDFMTAKRVAASRTMANHLSQRFWCTNCRNYFTEGILERYGLPPQSNDATEHAKYWNFGHNVASEHVASTRGDDPWIFQMGEASVAHLQNPYYVSFERAQEMWKYDSKAPSIAPTVAPAAAASEKLRGGSY